MPMQQSMAAIASFARVTRLARPGFAALWIVLLIGTTPAFAQLRGHGGPVRALAISADGQSAISGSFDLPAELLRVTSPSAEVQGHSEAERKTVGGKRNVTILSVDPVGNYAVRLGFDDMHSTGIYSWAFLRDLGLNAEQRFQDYLDDLQAKGLDRDRPGVR